MSEYSEPGANAETRAAAVAEALARARTQLGDRMLTPPPNKDAPDLIIDPEGDTLPALVALLEQLTEACVNLSERVHVLEGDARTRRGVLGF